VASVPGVTTAVTHEMRIVSATEQLHFCLLIPE